LPAQNLKATLEAVALLGTLTLALYAFWEGNAALFLRLPLQSVHTATVQLAGAIDGRLWKAAALFLVFGAVDLALQYRKHMSSLRMTKQEVREEHKRNEGDPQIKLRI